MKLDLLLPSLCYIFKRLVPQYKNWACGVLLKTKDSSSIIYCSSSTHHRVIFHWDITTTYVVVFVFLCYADKSRGGNTDNKNNKHTIFFPS